MYDSTLLSIELLDTNRAPLTGQLTDARSHAFSTSISINPLIAAAMPILSRASEIEGLNLTDATRWEAALQHEIRAFENSAHKNGYQAQMILAARYLLCTLLDELIETHHPKLAWSKTHSLLNHFQSETCGGDRFFIILERSFEDLPLYIDLLELGYLCLSFGYKGKYQDPSQYRALGLFIDQLYQLIEKQRGEQQPILTHIAHKTMKRQWHLPPWWITALSATVILFGIFIPYTIKLNETMAPLVYNITHYES